MNSPEAQTDIQVDKHSTAHIEEVKSKMGPTYESTDYSGAHEKTDPREIALVKKLDRWIMPMVRGMIISRFQ